MAEYSREGNSISPSGEWARGTMALIEKPDEREFSDINSACIFRIAHPLLTHNPKAYHPQVISMGPYHLKTLHEYQETESYKVKIARTMEKKISGFKFETLVKDIKKMNTEIRAFYDGDIPYSDDVLSLMLALDASFLLQFLLSIYSIYSDKKEGEIPMEVDLILHSKRKTPLWYAIQSDILMLENQVPLFLLPKVWNVTTPHTDGWDLDNILHAACSFFNPFSCGKDIRKPDKKARHILEYLHHSIICQPNPQQSTFVAKIISKLCPCYFQKKQEEDVQISHEKKEDVEIGQMKPKDVETSQKKTEEGDETPRKTSPGRIRHRLVSLQQSIRLPHIFLPYNIRHIFKRISSTTTGGSLPSATELHGAGVRFEPCSSRDMKEIHFNRPCSTLYLPKITINDSTEVVLRNLVALELYSDTNEKPITRYTYLMDRLIDTPEDVAVLKRCGIINSQMGSDREVSRMWNSMSKSLWENSFEPVDDAIEETSKYYRNKWRVLLAEYLQAHCSKPWVVLSVIAAVMLFILTFIQVFCAFYPCNKISGVH